MANFLRALQEALSITSIVVGVMLLLEFCNVGSGGRWKAYLARFRWGQYLLAGLLGVLPGCVGPFIIVSLYSHGAVSFGALVAAMFATTGDEGFVMFAMFPREAAVLHLILLVTGVGVGAALDVLFRGRSVGQSGVCDAVFDETQAKPERKRSADTNRPPGTRLKEWGLRVGLCALFAALAGGVMAGVVGPPVWNCVGLAMLALSLSVFVIILRADGHFLREHLWRHIICRHLPRIFLWTFGALVVTDGLVAAIGDRLPAGGGHGLLLFGAGALGLIPESGPHLVFVTLFERGVVPFAILLTSAVVQDGHGMLPLLGESRRAFVVVKAVKLAVGLAMGAAMLVLGR